MKTTAIESKLRTFQRVALYQSFTKAAEDLEVSKAHISKTINQLEDDLNCKLFNRSTRVVTLTPKGEELFYRCHMHLNALDKIKEDFINSSKEVKGHIRISLAGKFSEDFITPILVDFMKTHPSVTIQADYSEKIVNLIKDKYDLAIRFGNLKDSNLYAKKVASRKEYICCSPEFLHKHGTPSHPKDLIHYPCLLTNSSSWSFKRGISVKPQLRMRSNNPTTLCQASLSSLGICKLPEVYVLKHIKSGRLVSILENHQMDSIPIWAVTPHKDNRSLTISLLLKEVVEGLKNTPF